MHSAFLHNCTQPLASSIKIRICDSFFTKLKGWMFAKSIQPHAGLVLVQSSESVLDASIHMLFMNFDLAVIWADDDNRVVDLVHARKWALAYKPSAPAKYVYEVHPDRLAEFHRGDLLALENE